MKRWLTLLAVALALAAFSTLHAADEQPTPAEGEGAEKPAEIQMGDVEIRGELERPDVFYIIPRRKADMDLGSLTKDYEKEIMQPLLPAPFEATYRDTGGRGQ